MRALISRGLLAAVLFLAGTSLRAQDFSPTLSANQSLTNQDTSVSAPADPAAGAPAPAGGGYFANWFNRVDKTQAEQPRWATPLATTTPRLEEEWRYDINWLTSNTGLVSENYGNGKGLELIPSEHIEIILVGPPAYIVHNNPKVPNGFGDWGFLVKYRLLSGNADHGNYILTFFYQMSIPTGQFKNGATNPIITPTIAYGKGWKAFDMQGTFGVTLPTGNVEKIGHNYVWNHTFQYRLSELGGRIWPELELNYTHFQNGVNSKHDQLFLTPGVVFGRFKLFNRLNTTIGGGEQIAVTKFHTSQHIAIFSLRFPF